jgi:hypothetical protein
LLFVRFMRHIYDDNGTPENSMGVSIMQKTIAYLVISEEIITNT